MQAKMKQRPDEARLWIKDEIHNCRWSADDHDDEMLEAFATKHRDRRAALDFLRREMKRYGQQTVIVMVRFRSYWAATDVKGG